MTDRSSRTGRCVCGAVTFEAVESTAEVSACHCGTCRRWGGGPFVDIDGGTQVHFSGEDHVRIFASSEWAERAFCGTCGTHLYYRLKGTGSHYMPAGLFDDQSDFTLSREVFVDEQPHYYGFANPTERFTGPELMALFAGDPPSD